MENITGEVAKITADAVAFTPTDINKIADVLEHTTQVDKVPEEVNLNILCDLIYLFLLLFFVLCRYLKILKH